GLVIFEVVTRLILDGSQRRAWTNVYGAGYDCYDLKNWTPDGQSQIRMPNAECRMPKSVSLMGEVLSPRASLNRSVQASVQASRGNVCRGFSFLQASVQVSKRPHKRPDVTQE